MIYTAHVKFSKGFLEFEEENLKIDVNKLCLELF